jgi:hypothetical protein
MVLMHVRRSSETLVKDVATRVAIFDSIVIVDNAHQPLGVLGVRHRSGGPAQALDLPCPSNSSLCLAGAPRRTLRLIINIVRQILALVPLILTQHQRCSQPSPLSYVYIIRTSYSHLDSRRTTRSCPLPWSLRTRQTTKFEWPGHRVSH